MRVPGAKVPRDIRLPVAMVLTWDQMRLACFCARVGAVGTVPSA